MNRLDFIKKIGLATVGLPLLSSFGLPEVYLSVEDQVEKRKVRFEPIQRDGREKLYHQT